MLSLLWLLVIAASCMGYGLAFARLLRLDFDGRLERVTVATALGAGFLTLLTLALGLLGLLGRGAVLTAILPAAGFGIWTLHRTRDRSQPSAAPRWVRVGGLGLLVICAGANLFGALAPPSFIDALLYHLFAPREYLRRGAVVELPYIWQTYQPTAVEMLYTIGHALRGPTLAALTHAGLGLLAAGGTALIGRRLAGPVGGILAAAIFYCTAIVAWESTCCFVELGVAAFGTIGFYSVLRWKDSQRTGWLIAAALFTGFAATCKLNAAAFPIIGALLVIYFSVRQGCPPAAALRQAVMFGAIALAPVLPWYVRSYLWSGNPFYPFAIGFFGDNPDHPSVMHVFRTYGMGRSPFDLLAAPWRLFSNGVHFENGQHFSPLPILLAPVILWRARKPGEIQALLGVSLLLFAFWLASGHIARYLVPIQPIQAVLAADALCWLLAGTRRHRAMAIIVGAVFIGFGTVNTVFYNKQFAPVVLGRETEQCYLARTSWYYNVYQEMNASVPENGRLLTNLAPTYYLDRPHDRARNRDFEQPERLSQLLADGKFTHILVHGEPDLTRFVLAMGPRVQLVWHREVELSVSRTFGGTFKQPAAFFRVVRQ